MESNASKGGFNLKLMETPVAGGFLLVAFHWVVTSRLGRMLICPLLARKAGLSTLRAKLFEDPPRYTPHYSSKGDPGQGKPDTYMLPSTPKMPIGINTDGGFRFATCRDFHEAYLSQTTTPTKVAQHFVKSIALDARDVKPIQPVSMMDGTAIMEQAAASEERFKAGKPLGPLDGVPVLVKGDIDVKGFETTCGTSFLNKGKPAVDDAEAVRRLRAGGALILGKTRMHELGCDVTNNNPSEGTPRNPYNVDHYTGGGCG